MNGDDEHEGRLRTVPHRRAAVAAPLRSASRRGLASAGLSLLLLVAACSTIRIPVIEPNGRGEVGEASWYGQRHQGQRTASGERYDRFAMTAAHPDLSFGTRVRVKNLENGKSVVVRINDRGPFVRGRIIDLSYAAARTLGMTADGVARVRIEPLN